MGLFPRCWPRIRKSRLVWILVHLSLVFFSSTETAGRAAEAAFQFYRTTFALAASANAHFVAQKGIHFALFFSLGIILFHSLVAPLREKVFWVLVACLVVGICSESLQVLSPGRNPSLADVMLNSGSGLAAAVLLSVTTTAVPGLEAGTGNRE